MKDDGFLTAIPGKLRLSVATDAEGRFSFELPGSAEWLIQAEADGYAPDRSVLEGGGEHEIELYLRPVTTRSVRVIDERNVPVGGAEILVYNDFERPPLSRHVSADGGTVELPVRADGTILLIRAEHYETRLVGDAQEMLKESGDRIVLKPGFALIGAVTDVAGVPLSGVRVSVGERFHPERITTDDGRFRFDSLGLTSRHNLVMEREGYVSLYETAWPDDTEQRFVMHALVSVSGTVLLPDEAPVAGALVRAGSSTVRTDDGGRFRLEAVAPGSVYLVATYEQVPVQAGGQRFLDRYVGTTQLEAPPGRPLEGVRIRLQERGVSYVVVRLLGAAGTPLKAVVVNANGRNFRSTGRTDAHGRVTLACHAPPGSAVYLSVPWDKKHKRVGIEKRDRTTATPGEREIVLRAPRPATFSVVARGPEGEPLPPYVSAHIEVWLGPHWVESRARNRVTFAYTSGTTQTYALKIRAPGYVEFSQLPWRPPASGGTVEISLTPGVRIVGRLVDEQGDPVEEVSVVAVPEGGGRRVTGWAGTKGRFAIPEVRPARYKLWVFHQDEVVEEVGRIEVGTCPVHDAGTLKVSMRRSLRIVVEDRSGRRLAGARVVLFGGPGNLERLGEIAVTGRDGTTRIDLLPEAEAAVLIVKRRYGSVASRVPQGPELRVALPPPGKVRAAYYKGTAGPSGYSVSLRHPEIGITWQPKISHAYLPNSSVWMFSDVAPGEVEVVLWTPGKTLSRTVTVVEGTTVEAVFHWPR